MAGSSLLPTGALAQLFGILVLVGLVIKYWWLIALAIAAAWARKSAPKAWARHQAAVAADRRRLAAIAARADQQHAWVIASDPRGTYGEGSGHLRMLMSEQAIE